MADEKETEEAKVRTIRRATRKKYSAEEKMRIVLERLRGESLLPFRSAACQFAAAPRRSGAHTDPPTLPTARTSSSGWPHSPSLLARA